MRDHRGLLSRAEGCGTFDARDRMPRSSRLTAHPPTTIAENVPAATPVLPRERVRSSALTRYGWTHRQPARFAPEQSSGQGAEECVIRVETDHFFSKSNQKARRPPEV